MSRNILMIIAPDQFRDEELLVPRQAFLAQGWAVDTVSTQVGDAKGMLGAVETVRADLSHAEAQAAEKTYDAAVVVGGMGSIEYLWNNQRLHALLQSISSQGKVVSAICLSGCVLANAGLLKGKKATVWEMPESLDIYKAQGVDYTGDPVTTDGDFITANGPDAAKSFSDAIIARVKALTPA